MLTLKSKFSEFISACNLKTACSVAMSTVDKIKTESVLGADEPFGDAMIKTLAEDTKTQGASVVQGYCMWTLVNIGSQMDEKSRLMFFNKIITPVAAFRLYLALPYLSDEEDKLLESKFRPDGKILLPTAEKELEDGIVIRAKVIK